MKQFMYFPEASSNMSQSNDPCRTPVHRYKTRPSIISAGDDSPTLSQEPVKVTWKWNNENTPIRSTAGSSKLKYERLLKKSPINGNLRRTRITNIQENSTATSTVTSTSSTTLADSPKGLFKFQQEMRQFQLANNETGRCDNDDIDMQTTLNSMHADNVSVYHLEDDKMDIGVASTSNAQSAIVDKTISDPLKQALLNDSDFDQVLLMCTEVVEQKLTQEQMATGTVKNMPTDANKCLNAEPSQNCNYRSLLNDESFDDVLGNIDDSAIMQSIHVKNSKLSRHKSMPQESQPHKQQSQSHPQRSPYPPQPQNSTVTTNRRSFARHESMPAAVTNKSGRQANTQTSKWIFCFTRISW